MRTNYKEFRPGDLIKWRREQDGVGESLLLHSEDSSEYRRYWWKYIILSTGEICCIYERYMYWYAENITRPFVKDEI